MLGVDPEQRSTHVHTARFQRPTVIRVVVVDSEPAMKQGLCMRLAVEPDIEVVGAVSDCVQALAQVAELQPDVVLIDTRLPCLDDAQAAQAVHAIAPGTVVLILTLRSDPGARALSSSAGAAALIEKSAGDAALLAAIRTAVVNTG